MQKLSIGDIERTLPSSSHGQEVQAAIMDLLSQNPICTVVLDDDPTGTQTVHDVDVLTKWTPEGIREQFRTGNSLFYILTNSRSKDEGTAIRINEEIGRMIFDEASEAGVRIRIISRSDSTLRGHYPAETEALRKTLKLDDATVVLVPAFFEGGRYTIGDVHYVEERGILTPAADTPFAADRTFGYQASNLRRWVVEKTRGKVKETEIDSLSLEDLRTKEIESLTDHVHGKQCQVLIVNAITHNDLERAVLALMRSELKGKKYIYRTAASIVPIIAGQIPRDILNAEDLEVKNDAGGLIVVGSYVPKTTAQLEYLIHKNNVVPCELPVKEMLLWDLDGLTIREIGKEISGNLAGGKHMVVYTSRELIEGADKKESLNIVNQVAEKVNRIVREISVRPAYLIAKGGITSSDIATKCLGVRKAFVKGQILPGIPLWQIDGKWPGLNYVVFPGNVGTDRALSEVFEKFTGS